MINLENDDNNRKKMINRRGTGGEARGETEKVREEGKVVGERPKYMERKDQQMDQRAEEDTKELQEEEEEKGNQKEETQLRELGRREQLRRKLERTLAGRGGRRNKHNNGLEEKQQTL